MEETDCKIGATVKITQYTEDQGIVGKIVEPYGSPDPQYYTIEGCKHRYTANQMELVKNSDLIINKYQIY